MQFDRKFTPEFKWIMFSFNLPPTALPCRNFWKIAGSVKSFCGKTHEFGWEF